LVDKTRTVCIARAPDTSEAMAVPWAGGSKGGADDGAGGAGGGAFWAAALPATSRERISALFFTWPFLCNSTRHCEEHRDEAIQFCIDAR
jgi:hypothetical protein